MSASLSFTTPSPPVTTQVASQLLATMAALTGIPSDYNIGSQIRTMAEAGGSVVEIQGVSNQAQALQAILFSGFSAFDIMPNGASYATGTVQFDTGTGASPPVATQNVNIAAGTIVSTSGGVQFQTVSAVTLLQGQTSVTANVSAMTSGTAGNVSANTITQILTGLTYPLYVSNATPTSGGVNAETQSQTQARFSSAIAAIGLGSPTAIANAVIGVTVSGTGETVQYSTVYEPWITASGTASGQALWELYVDNGSGTASASLISAIGNMINGVRDAGVPYTINAVEPTFCVVSVSGTMASGQNSALSAVSGLIAAAVSGYFALPFGATATQAALAGSVANSVPGYLSSLAISLFVSGSATAVSGIAVPAYGRNLLGSVAVTLAAAAT